MGKKKPGPWTHEFLAHTSNIGPKYTKENSGKKNSEFTLNMRKITGSRRMKIVYYFIVQIAKGLFVYGHCGHYDHCHSE